MRRFRAENPQIGAVVPLSPEESRHAARALRLKTGDLVALFDGRGREWDGEIAETDAAVTVRVLRERNSVTAVRLVVASACPKGKRLDFMIQKLSELGVERFVPVRFTRSVVRMTDARRDRLERVAAEASKQCGRADVLTIEEETEAPDFGDRAFYLAIPGADEPLIRVGRLPAAVLIGPEGGITPEEEARFLSSGAKAISLGPTTLRIETAAIAAASVLVQLHD